MTENKWTNEDWHKFISRHDLTREPPPVCWQDGLICGNGSLGAVFSFPGNCEWIVNKTDVIDSRVKPIRRIIPPDEAAAMVRDGATAADFEREEVGQPVPEGLGPKSCCILTMDLGMSAGSGTRTALPGITSRLCLYDATLNVNMDKHLCHPRVESFVRADEDMLVVRVTDVSPFVSNQTRLFLTRPPDIELGEPRIFSDNDRTLLEMDIGENFTYVVGLQVIARPSKAYRNDILPRIREKYHPPLVGVVQQRISGHYGIIDVGGDFDFYLTVATTRDCPDPRKEVHDRLDRATRTLSYDQIRKIHCSWWESYWQKSRVELSDNELEMLYYQSLYYLGCSYRKAPISGLLGLCYGPSVGPLQISPWTGDLHHDLNVQCPFFPVHALNHSELFEAYMATYESFLPEARRLAKDVWGVTGAHFDMCFNAAGKSIFGGAGHYRYFFGGSYVGLMHCLAWRYKHDVEELRTRIYPFLKEILEFYANVMKMGEDGKYHLDPAHAPELDIMNTSDPVQTIAMLKVCLETAVEATQLLQIDDSLKQLWQDLLDQLPEYPIGIDSKGRRIILDALNVPADHHVGQAGPLHPVYPCGQIDEFSNQKDIDLYLDTLESAVEKTAQKSYAVERDFYYSCVWQCFFRAMTALRLGKVDEFWSTYMTMFLRAYTKPNGMISHDACVIVDSADSEANIHTIPDITMSDIGQVMPAFEPWCGHNGGSTPNPAAKALSIPLIEGSADYLTMITECLLQSHNGIIRVFPGWPKDKDAEFTDLIAEGNIRISAKYEQGEVTFIKLCNNQKKEYQQKTTVKIVSPWTGKIEVYELPAGKNLFLTAI